MKTRKLIIFILIFLVLFTLIVCTNTKKCADGKHNTKWVVTIEPSCKLLRLNIFIKTYLDNKLFNFLVFAFVDMYQPETLDFLLSQYNFNLEK